MWDELQELREEIALLKSILRRLVCTGEVVEIDESLHRVRVKLHARDEMVTGFLSVLVPYAHSSYAYGLPKVGDTVLCILLPYGMEDGFVVGSYYHVKEEPPATGREKFFSLFADGGTVEYDEGSSKLLVRSGNVEVNSNVVINGNLIVNGEITDMKGSLTNHTNGGVPRD